MIQKCIILNIDCWLFHTIGKSINFSNCSIPLSVQVQENWCSCIHCILVSLFCTNNQGSLSPSPTLFFFCKNILEDQQSGMSLSPGLPLLCFAELLAAVEEKMYFCTTQLCSFCQPAWLFLFIYLTFEDSFF